jgi:NAD(P)-dependent dehydrogenase (short-subunit alcohol dehydrogenase family)
MARQAAIITGGTAGVGLAVVRQLIVRGYNVGIIARGQDRLDQVQQTHGADRIATQQCDVADAEAMMAAADKFVTALGAPRVWINCAMLTSFSPFERMPPDEFERIMAATFTGQVNGTRAALRVMPSAGKPVIVNVGSGLSYRSVPFQSAYCAAKHAINGFSAAVQAELVRAEHPVRISLVQLPAMDTPQYDWSRHRFHRQPRPAPPVYEPDVAARAVMRAVDERNRELLVGQSVFKLLLGDMVLPGWLDDHLADADANVGAHMHGPDRTAVPQDGNLYEADAEQSAHARGSYGRRAKKDGFILDADRVRLAVFAGVPAATFLLGFAFG